MNWLFVFGWEVENLFLLLILIISLFISGLFKWDIWVIVLLLVLGFVKVVFGFRICVCGKFVVV